MAKSKTACDTRYMFVLPVLDASDADAFYDGLATQLDALIGDETDRIANLANAAALIWHTVPGLNWAGFYLRRGEELVLGPFQGKPACIRIALGTGVCGTAAARNATVRVEDVHAFPGHIACDGDSMSELVVPMRDAGQVVAVLDLDSPTRGRFTDNDAAGVERLVSVLERAWQRGRS